MSGRRITRPTTDRVKEAVFNILMGRTASSKVLDLFAGSGAMGIEALSRGAAKAVFVELNPAASEVIRINIENCGFTGVSHVIVGKLPGALKHLRCKERDFDIIFVDPPYEKGLARDMLDSLVDEDEPRPGGLVVVEHSERDGMPEEKSGLKRIKQKKYGSTIISIYERELLENAR